MILNPFKDKNILITGGSKGIGLEMAKEFARLKANVAIIARDKVVLDEARRLIEEAGPGTRCLAYACDVTDADTLRDYINMVRYEFGSIDGIIANSGYCHPGNFHELDFSDIDRQIDVNLKGVLYTLRLSIPHLLENKNGFIAITSSPAGNAGIFGFGIYGPTKAALNNLSYVLRSEYENKNIRVHLLLPPDTDTPGYKLEVPMYPKETKAVLDGGQLLYPERVAKIFVQGIANNRKVIAAGSSTKLLLRIMRFTPFLWDAYCRWKVRSAQKVLEEVAPVESAEAVETEEPVVSTEAQTESPRPATDVPEPESTAEDVPVEEPESAPEPQVDPEPEPEPEESTEEVEEEALFSGNGWKNHVESKVALEFEDLKPFLDRITKYANGLDRAMPDLFTGIADMDSKEYKSWEINTIFEGRKLTLRLHVALDAKDSIELRFEVPMKLAMIIEQERDRMVGY
ncbi:MAG: SDR family NAD(P)-dependent oxidoreductase [Candidatus Hydrogenedentota bacterium]